MHFTSIEFAVFLPVVFVLYWFGARQSLRSQNLTILAASYVFYGRCDWRFLSLIVLVSLSGFIIGNLLERTANHRSRLFLMLSSILINLGVLAFFKYVNFFSESLANTLRLLGTPIEAWRLQIVLPLGISFYTLQAVGYTVDVYRKKVKASHDLVAFLGFISFFPKLVAGPIERASGLLAQFSAKRTFNADAALNGLRQVLWGLFKKIVIADNCAVVVSRLFADYGDYSGSALLIGTLLFTFQIYCDFSGYSDIAIGISRLFGFDLMRNFACPYFSRNAVEFWHRWHISLSTWFRDYLYIPLGGNRKGMSKQIRNVFVVFIASGLWHGANWTYAVWGFIHACYLVPLLVLNANRRPRGNSPTLNVHMSFTGMLQTAGTFILIAVAWVFFRSESLKDAFAYLAIIVCDFNASACLPELLVDSATSLRLVHMVAAVGLLLVVEWKQRNRQHGLDFERLTWRHTLLCYGVFLLIVLTGDFGETEFIYGQF